MHRQTSGNRVVEEVDVYDLVKSRRSVQELYPVIKDAYGNVIDGFHRLEADPNWKTETLEQIKTPVQLVLARIIANTHRRSVSKEERKIQFVALAEELVKEGVAKDGVIPTIAELTTFSDDYLRRLLPAEYKPRPGIGGAGDHKSVGMSPTQDHEHVYDAGSTNCRICGRELTAPESVKAGIGPVCASGKPRPLPEEIYATINDLYTHFENPTATFVVSLLQQKHGLGYEGAQKAHKDYKNSLTQPLSPTPDPTKTLETNVTVALTPKEPILMLVELLVRETPNSGNVTWCHKIPFNILPGQNLEIKVNGDLVHQETAVELPDENEEEQKVSESDEVVPDEAGYQHDELIEGEEDEEEEES